MWCVVNESPHIVLMIARLAMLNHRAGTSFGVFALRDRAWMEPVYQYIHFPGCWRIGRFYYVVIFCCIATITGSAHPSGVGKLAWIIRERLELG